MHLALKDSLTRDTLHNITQNTHSPLVEITFPQSASQKVSKKRGVYKKKKERKKPPNLTHITHSHQSFLMTSQRPLSIRPLTPSRRARGSVFFLSAHSADLVCDDACHQIDDNDSNLLELIGVESVKGWPDGFLESIFVLECDDAHLRE